LVLMQKWEYSVFASHLDPAELVLLLNKSGLEGWELVSLVPVTDYCPPELIYPAAPKKEVITSQEPVADAAKALVPVAAFRYIFKRTVG
jgi:hypothetical protein